MNKENKHETEIVNRKAYHDYFIESTLECGIALRGNEVKSIRCGKASIRDTWCSVQSGELILRGMHISKWDTSNDFDVDEGRERVLLVHKPEIMKLAKDASISGYTLIPLKIYFNHGRVKVLLGTCRGKHVYDKREDMKKLQMARDIQRSLR